MPHRLLSSKAMRIFAMLLLPALLVSGCRTSPTLENQINGIVAPYGFSIFNWEVKSLSQEISQVFSGTDKAQPDQSQVVVDYFNKRC